MNIILIFLLSIVLANGISYGLLAFLKIDVDPSLISMFMLTVFMFIPDRWIKKLNFKNNE